MLYSRESLNGTPFILRGKGISVRYADMTSVHYLSGYVVWQDL